MSQREDLLKHLSAGYSVTDREAEEKLCIGRLSARIHELRHKYGYNIVTDMVKVMKSNGKHTRIGAYRLVKDKNE